MRRARPLPYFAEAPITTIVAVVVTAIAGIVAFAAAPLLEPVRWLAAFVVFVIGVAVVIYELPVSAPALISALRRMFRRRR